jgi:hypothetical protein
MFRGKEPTCLSSFNTHISQCLRTLEGHWIAVPSRQLPCYKAQRGSHFDRLFDDIARNVGGFCYKSICEGGGSKTP